MSPDTPRAATEGAVGTPLIHVDVHLQMSDLLFGGPEGKPGDGILDNEEPPEHMRRRPQEPPPGDGETLFNSDDNR